VANAGSYRSFMTAHTSIVVRVAVIIYLAQAAAGFAVGLTLPWLRFLGVS
jgi:hypothetical protein